MKKQKQKRKKWPPYKYWTEFLRQEGSIWIEDNKTINYALARILLDRDGKKYSQQKLDDFAKYLERGRNKAIIDMWEAGEERYVLGSSRIEAITNDPENREEHLRRLGKQGDVKTIAIAKKSLGASAKECADFGLPLHKRIQESKQRLLLGDNEFGIHLGRMK